MESNLLEQSAEKKEPVKAPESTMGARIAGLVLALPALLLGIATILVPAVGTIQLSLEKYGGFTPPVFIGTRNYIALLSNPAIQSAFGNLSTTTWLTLLLVGLASLLACLGAAWLGRGMRLALRLLLSLPLAAFAPFFWVSCWTLSLNPNSPMGATIRALLVNGPFSGARVFALASGLFAAGLVGAVTGLFFLSIRPAHNQRRNWLVAAIMVWLIGMIATVAVIAQDFVYPIYFPAVSSAGNANLTPALEIYRLSWVDFQLGEGAAMSSILIALAVVLGLLATLLIAASGIRLAWNPGQPAPAQKSVLAVILLVLGLLGLLAVLVAGLLPVLGALLAGSPASSGIANLLHLQVNTGLTLMQFLPLLILQLPLTYLAALGIGGLRPLGRGSEWLLLLFGGGLFLTFLPMQSTVFSWLRSLNLIDTTQGLLLGGCLLNVPMLFILTLFFKGQYPAWRDARAAGQRAFTAFLKYMLLPSLPLALLLVLASGVVTLWDVTWPSIILTKPETLTFSAWLVHLYPTSLNLGTFIPFILPQLILALIILVPAQIFYLDRLEVKR